jgi:uridine kinase
MNRHVAIHEIAAMIAELPLGHPVRVAVDGRDGAGKTMLADELVQPLQNIGRPVIRASIDGFHNPRLIRYGRGRDSAAGYFLDSYNYASFRESLLHPLGPAGSRRYRTAVFDHRTDSPVVAPLKHASDDAICIVDGIFLHRAELIEYWDFRIFVEVRVETGLERCAARDGSSADPHADSNRRYVEGQEIYFSECNPRDLAHVIFVNDDLANPALFWNSAPRG